jgi:TolA-binding protein
MSSTAIPVCGWYVLIALVVAAPAWAQAPDPFLSAPSRPRPVAPVAPRPTPPPGPQPGTPEAFLQQGNAALRRQDYAAAEAAAREILKVRKSPYAVDAHFLLAESFVGRRDYSHAADAYDDAYDDARAGPRAQDALLGRAKAFVGYDRNWRACSTLDTLKKEFSAPRPDLVAQISAVRQQAACH